MAALLRDVDPGDIDAWFVKNQAKIMAIIKEGWLANRTLAATYLRDHAEANRTYTEVFEEFWQPAAVARSIQKMGPAVWKKTLSKGGDSSAARRDMTRALTKSMFRHTMNGSRDTVMKTVRKSSRIIGFRRSSTTGSPCTFCAMLMSRGAVYSKESANFEAHDSDACVPEPMYRKEKEPKEVLRLQAIWNEATKDLSGKEAIKAFGEALHNPGG